jgi:hypothetical protein
MSKRNIHDSAQQETAPLLVKADTACKMLGGIHSRTLARLEKRRLIRPLPGLLRHKLYSIADIKSLIENLKTWEA